VRSEVDHTSPIMLPGPEDFRWAKCLRIDRDARFGRSIVVVGSSTNVLALAMNCIICIHETIVVQLSLFQARHDVMVMIDCRHPEECPSRGKRRTLRS
jgi:hypothetical protein